MKMRKARRRQGGPLRLALALGSWLLAIPRGAVAGPLGARLSSAASSSPSATAEAEASDPTPAASAAAGAASDASPRDDLRRAFLDRFDVRGPTVTLTLRDPSSASLLGPGVGAGKGKVRRRTSASTGGGAGKPPILSDDRGFGISSKLAALFHISSSASTTNGGGASSSSPSGSGGGSRSQFAEGYMLDDGGVYLSPPSSSDTAGSGSSRSLFSIRGMGSGILGGGVGSLSEYAENLHPDIRYEVESKATPFPESAPWLTGLDGGMVWSPFPAYKPGYPEGYGHKLLSVPHFVRCGARLSLPRLAALLRRSTSQGITGDFTSAEDARWRKRDLELGAAYRESPYRPGGTLDLRLGRARSHLPPPTPADVAAAADYRKNNHLLVRLAIGRPTGPTRSAVGSPNQILASIERASGSFRLPAPSLPFLRDRFGRSDGRRVFVAPSFDFREGRARCAVSGDVGRAGRTRAVLRLDSEEETTLTVVRALDDSKIIAPTISLNSGKIVYDYYLSLDGTAPGQHWRPIDFQGKASSSIRAHVDPTRGILFKWIDGVRGGRAGGSCWVAECRVPLGTTAPGPLAADLRIGRRWVI